MANSRIIAISSLRELELTFHWKSLKEVTNPEIDGPVYLKGNQNTQEVLIRTENGLGEGILIGCHYFSEKFDIKMLGPLPLNFFKIK